MDALQDWINSSDFIRRYSKFREATNAFFEDPASSKAAGIYNILMTFSILVSVAIVLLETVPSPASNGVEYPQHYLSLSWSKRVYSYIELFFTVVFTGELVLRFWAAPNRIFKLKRAPSVAPSRQRVSAGPRGNRGRDSVIGTLPGTGMLKKRGGAGALAGLPGMGGVSLGRSGPAGLPGMGGVSLGSPETHHEGSGIDGALSVAEVQENRTMTVRRKSSFRGGRRADTDEPFTSDPYNWLDLIAILPYYVERILVLTADGKEGALDLSVIRTFRICRIFKIFRRFNDTEVLVTTVRRVWRPLLLPFFFFLLFSFLFGSIVWFLEPCYLRDSCQFPHIFSAFYFCMVTMTTVGYGDQIPERWHSRFVTMVIMLFGSLFLSMPLSVIGSEFDSVYKEREKAKEEEKKAKEKEEQMRADEAAGVKHDNDNHSIVGSERANETKPVNLTRFFLIDEYVKVCETIGLVRSTVDSLTDITLLDEATRQALMKNINRTIMNMYTLAMKVHRLAKCPKDELKKNVVRDDEKAKRASNRMKMAMRGLSGKKGGSTLDVLINSAKDMTSDGSSGMQLIGEIEVKAQRRPLLEVILGGISSITRAVVFALRHFSVRCARIRSTEDIREGLRDLKREANMQKMWLSGRYTKLKMFFSGEDTDFFQQVQDAKISGKFRDQLWLGLEGLDQSMWSKTVQHVLLVCIILSTIVFAFQTDASYTVMGESSVKCQDLVKMYCNQWGGEKFNHPPFSGSLNEDIGNVGVADPGCFMWDGRNSLYDRPLKFSSECSTMSDTDIAREQCFGVGYNFGSVENEDAVVEVDNNGVERGHLSCDQWTSYDTGDSGSSIFLPRPFRSQDLLPIYSWMEPTAAYSMNTIHDICMRPECYNGHETKADMRQAWIYLEASFAFVFTIEMIARLLSARSLALLVVDPYFIIDVASLLPFYIEIATAKDDRKLDFSIGPTDDPIMSVIKLLKVARIFKMTRQNPKVSILWETAVISLEKLTIPFVFLFLMLISFGVVLYQFESGVDFNVKDCLDDDLQSDAHKMKWCEKRLTDDALANAFKASISGHSRLKVDIMDGAIASLPSAFEAIWLTIVTMTTVGYGGVSPITPLGKITSAVVMLFGSFYLSMPLTIVGSVFYQCYKKQEEAERQMMANIIQAAQDRDDSTGEIKLSKSQSELLTKYKEHTTALERLFNKLKSGEGTEEFVIAFKSAAIIHTELVYIVIEVDKELLRLQTDLGVADS